MSHPPGSSGTGGASGTSTPLTLDSGRTVIRRLNRTEYTLTVRDLLGTSLTPLASLDPESATDFFDTIGEFLSISPLQLETMETAASALTDELFALPPTDPKRTKVFVCALTAGAEATCARQILTAFARKAFRRPAATAEIDSLMALVDKVRAGGTYQDGLKAATSPRRNSTYVGDGRASWSPQIAVFLSRFGQRHAACKSEKQQPRTPCTPWLWSGA